MSPEYKKYFVRIPIESTESFEGLMNYMPGWGIVAESDSGKNPAAVVLGKLGGAKGGPALAAKMTPEQRSASARKAVNARWHPQ